MSTHRNAVGLDETVRLLVEGALPHAVAPRPSRTDVRDFVRAAARPGAGTNLARPVKRLRAAPAGLLAMRSHVGVHATGAKGMAR